MAIANVLLVDDEEGFVETMSKRLAKRALNVSKAFSGASALEYLAKHGDVEVVILDVKMPGMDGLAAARTIRQRHANRGPVPIVAMTANALPEQVAAYRAAGMDGYVVKPIDRDNLLMTRTLEIQ